MALRPRLPSLPRLGLPPALRPAGWRHLPRDARDTLFLLCVIGWTVLPHVAHLPAWCSLLTLAVLLWRARLALDGGALPSRWVLVGVLLVAGVLTLWSHQTLLGKDAGVTMAVVLMALKTLELRARRDAFVVFFLGFFLILTHFLESQSLLVAFAMLVSVWGLLTALVLAHMPVGQPSLRIAARLAARTALLGMPVMLLLFMLFPRIGPLWGVPQDGSARTGLSESLRLGSMVELAQDDSIAMRLRFEGPAPAPAAMYFRGPVLSRFDGIEWKPALPAARVSPRTTEGVVVSGPPVRFEVTLEPLRLTALPLLEATVVAPRIEGRTVTMSASSLEWRSERPVTERLRFEVESQPSFRYGRGADPVELRDHVALPPGYNPRIHALAAEMRRDPAYAAAPARVLVDALLQQIRSGDYRYTLAPGTYGRDAIDEFWFDRRQGFCEHFASAFVVLLRALDVPARIVTGFQGTDPIPIDGYHVVRQSAAHAWAEYWEPERGWVRADPTAAVAPERIDRSRRLAPERGLVGDALATVNPEWLARWRGSWEAIDNRWNQWILNYSRRQQVDVLRSLGFDSPSWEDLALLLIGSLSTLALGAAAWAWWDRRRVDPWARQAERLRRALHAIGVEARPADPPRTLAGRLRARFGEAAAPLTALLEALERQRYGPNAVARPDRALTRHFVALAVALGSHPMATSRSSTA